MGLTSLAITFKDCVALERIVIPDSVAVIRDGAFGTSLTLTRPLGLQLYIKSHMIGYTEKEYAMSTKLVTFRMDEQDKAEFDQFCSEVGISVSNAFVMFAKTVVRERRIPFEIATDPFYSEENLRALRRSASDADAGRFAAQASFDDFDALVAGL
jgi:DNA-damage-inducible protein J